MILSLETSSEICSVAIHNGSELYAHTELNKLNTHAENITVIIRDLLKYNKLEIQELKAVAVSKGPGSYTGLRIGVSVAKGLCFSLDIPLIAINTLECLAYQFQASNTQKALLAPMLDARRMEVYCSLYDPDLMELMETKALILDEQSFESELENHQIVFFGSGSNKFSALVKENPNAFFANGISPSAKSLGQLAHTKYQNSKFEDLTYFEPFYLKDFMLNKPNNS